MCAGRAAADAEPPTPDAAPIVPTPLVAVDGDIVTLHYDCKDSEGEVSLHCACQHFLPHTQFQGNLAYIGHTFRHIPWGNMHLLTIDAHVSCQCA